MGREKALVFHSAFGLGEIKGYHEEGKRGTRHLNVVAIVLFLFPLSLLRLHEMELRENAKTRGNERYGSLDLLVLTYMCSQANFTCK
ncbi:hypothetical protein KFK09_001408 [Dendrobium nobile]|uniref:Uncharacterized protein n=1 Tax=Dendrobium nobile TaxID=94219 RepID=A0A8T3CAS4_DENNO|nr:hypothetical protein KFK09_001408 [Dendrobium nobile]